MQRRSALKAHPQRRMQCVGGNDRATGGEPNQEALDPLLALKDELDADLAAGIH